MKHMPNPKTRDSGTSRLTWMYACGEDRPLRGHEICKSTALYRWVHYGKSADPATSPLAAEGTINTPDTDTWDP